MQKEKAKLLINLKKGLIEQSVSLARTLKKEVKKEVQSSSHNVQQQPNRDTKKNKEHVRNRSSEKLNSYARKPNYYDS